MNLRLKILELSAREAEMDVAQAATRLKFLQEANAKLPGTVPQNEIKQSEITMERKKLALERFRTLLEIHLKVADEASSEPTEGIGP